MKKSSTKSTRRIYLLALLSLLILAIPSLVVADSNSAQEALQSAWERATANGRYQYQADVIQTTHPTARLENVGRTDQVQYLTVSGEMDNRQETMQLEMQSGNNPPLAVKVESGIAYGFDPETETWSEMEGVADVFAPGGDPLGFLTAVTNVQLLDDTSQSAFPANDLLPPGYTDSLTRYAFDIDALQYARFMRDQMEQHLRQQGELLPGMHLETSPIYNKMQGHGELWLNEAGLPLRQLIHLEFPPQENASEWVEAQITTEFQDWQTGPVGFFHQLQQNPQLLWRDPLSLFAISAVEVQQASLNIGLSLLVMALVALMILHRRSRLLYAGLSFGIIFSMLTGPLLQGVQFEAVFERQRARQVANEQEELAQAEEEQLQAEMTGADFNPRRNPLSKTAVAPAQAPITPPACNLPQDTDCDDNEDDDNDGLTDWVEKYGLGTDPESVDSDNDFLSDNVEVMGYFGNGRQWYLNPLDPDSNDDGFIDTLECPDLVDLDTNGAFITPTGTTCADTDSDGVADIFDHDNDGDGVPDRQDSAPNYVGNLSTQAQDEIEFSLDGFDNSGRPLIATFELRPTVYEHLYQTNNVVDWPHNDTTGQVMRVNDNTFADLGFSGSEMAQGDLMLVPMLEIIMPDPANNSSNPSSGLPILSSFGGDVATSPLSDWLDTDALDEYGIFVSQDADDGQLYAYVPLHVIEDDVGGAPLAWGAQMLYRPESNAFGQAHEIRLVWQVQGLLDSCDTSGMSEDDDYDEWCATDSGNWVSNMAVIHAYYDPFHITGLTVQEDYGYEMAIMGQADALSVPYEGDLWHIGNSLMSTFVEGKLVDGSTRFDINEIDSRLGAGSGTVWDVDLSNLIVEYSSYPDQVSGIRGMLETAVPDLLTTNYAAATTGDAVTLLIAREEAFKTIGLEQLAVGDITNSGGHLAVNVSLAAQTTQTYATLNWTPYEYDGLDWAGADIFDQVDRLRDNLQTAVTDADITQMVSWFNATPTDIAAARIGIISMARNFYLAMYSGKSNVVADSTAGFLNDEIVDNTIYSLDFNNDGLLDDPLLIYIAIGVGLLQSIIEREDNTLLTEFSDILELIGYLEAESDADAYSSNAILIRSAGKALKGMIKKAFKILYNGPANATKYYEYRSKVTLTTTVMSIISAGIGIYVGLSGDKNKHLLRTMYSLNLITETVGAVESVYLIVRAGKGYGDAVTTLATISKLESSTKISAAITFVFDLAIATTFFVLAASQFEPGSFAFNALLALYIAQIILAIIVLIISSTIVGSVIVAVIGLIDALIGFICKYNGEQESGAVKRWVCGGISGIVTQILVYAVYDMAIVADLEHKNRLSFGIDAPTFHRGHGSNQDGAVVGNNVTVSLDITHTLKMGSPTGLGSSYAALSGQFFTNQNLKRSAFDYHLQDNNETDYIDSLTFGELSWPGSKETFTVNHTFSLDKAGLNMPPSELYLTESMKVPAMECWGFVVQYCSERVFRQAVHMSFAGQFPFDVFPQSFAEFMTMTAVSQNSYRMDWSREMPVLWDADGDGLVSQIMGGPDPNDGVADADGDGLSDFSEYENGTNLLLADSDNDGLSDYWELFYDTNPLLADSDGDSLLDGEELFHPDDLYPYEANPTYPRTAGWSGGWQIVYDYNGGSPLSTLVTADPLDTDVDGDFINDSKERVYGYNPYVAEALNILSLDTSTEDVVAAGGTLPYTATIHNELDNRILNGLLQAEFPVDTVQNTAVIDTLFPQQAVTMTGSVIAPNLHASDTTSLTLRAGAIIEDPDTGHVLWLHVNESGNASTFQDDALSLGGPHDATCVGTTCPSTNNGDLQFDGNQFITVTHHPELDLTQFTVSLWIRRNNLGNHTLLAKGATGLQIVTNNRALNSTIYLADCTTPVTANATGIVNANQWYNIIVTYDGNTLTEYFNGTEVASVAAPSICTNSDALKLGDGLDGTLDEIEIYANALNSTQVASLFKKPVFYLSGLDTPPLGFLGQSDHANFGFNYVFCADDELTGLEHPDCASYVDQGAIGPAIGFDETDRLEVNNPTVNSFRDGPLHLGGNDNTFTMSMWMKPRTNYTPNNAHFNNFGQMVLGYDIDGLNKAYPSLYIQDRKVIVRFGHEDGAGYCEATSTNILSHGTWQHVTVVFDGNVFHPYINGQAAASFSGANCANENIYPNDSFFIGYGRGNPIKFTSIDSIVGANNGEGFIVSSSNIYHNGIDTLDLIWNSAEGEIDGGATVNINGWAIPGREHSRFAYCDRDDPEDGVPNNGCSDQNYQLFLSLDPILRQKIHLYDDPATRTVNYNLVSNPYNLKIHYNLYTTGFKGDLDEIRLYRSALTAEEAIALYEGSLRSLELPFDEPPGQDILADVSSNQFEAICSGTVCPDSGIPGRDNQSVRFDGVDDVLTLPSADTLGLTGNSFTVMAWVKGSAFSGDQAILGTDGGVGDLSDLFLGTRNGKPYMSFGGVGNDVIGATTLQPDQWYHLAFRYNAGGQHQTIYLNGGNTGDAWSGAGVRDSFEGTGVLRVGSADGGNHFQGLIDHLVIVRKSLTFAEIQAVMNEVPLLNLHLDEDFNTSAFVDDTPYANHATCTACPAAGAKGQMREAPVFDGSQVLQITNADEVDALSNQFSIVGWIKPTDVVGHHRIVAHARTNSGNGFGFGVKDGGLAFTTWGIQGYF